MGREKGDEAYLDIPIFRKLNVFCAHFYSGLPCRIRIDALFGLECYAPYF